MVTRDINQTMNRLSNNILKNGLLEYTQNLVRLLAEKWEVPDSDVKNLNLASLVQNATPKVVTNKKRIARKKMPQGAPSKNKTAYIIFSTEIRSELATDENGDKVPFSEVGKLIGQRWKAMDSEDKQIYMDRALEDKERFIREMKEFDPEFREKEKIDPSERQLMCIEEAKNKSDSDTIYCYNVSSGRQLKYDEKNKDKCWNTALFLCGNTQKEVDTCIEKLELEEPKKVKGKSKKR